VSLVLKDALTGTQAGTGFVVKEIQNKIIACICICVCVHIEREKEGRETADENHSYKHLLDGVSESTNKRQE